MFSKGKFSTEPSTTNTKPSSSAVTSAGSSVSSVSSVVNAFGLAHLAPLACRFTLEE
jgi:hypothetical protein